MNAQLSIDKLSDQQLKDLVFQANAATIANNKLVEMVFNEVSRRAEKQRFEEELKKTSKTPPVMSEIRLPKLKKLTGEENHLTGSW